MQASVCSSTSPPKLCQLFGRVWPNRSWEALAGYLSLQCWGLSGATFSRARNNHNYIFGKTHHTVSHCVSARPKFESLIPLLETLYKQVVFPHFSRFSQTYSLYLNTKKSAFIRTFKSLQYLRTLKSLQKCLKSLTHLAPSGKFWHN